jgi:hypothetical protein
MQDKLNKYFETAANQSLLMDEGDVADLLNKKRMVVKTYKWFNLKFLIAMITLTACIYGVYTLFLPIDNNPTSQFPGAKSTSNAVTSLQNSEDNDTAQQVVNKTNSKQQLTNTHISLPVSEPLQSTNFYSYPPSSSEQTIRVDVYSYEDGIDSNRIYFNEEGELILTFNELADLGIITDGYELNYANITDSIQTVTYDSTERQEFPCFKVNVFKSGDARSINAFTSNLHIVENSKSFFPIAFAAKAKNKENRLTHTEQLYGDESHKKYLTAMSSLVVPVKVSLTSNAKGLYSKTNLVFWFKPTQSFYDALPNDVAVACIQRFGVKPEEQFKDSLHAYRKAKIIKKAVIGFDSVEVKNLQKNYVSLSHSHLKLLGINTFANGFKYKAIHKRNNSAVKKRVHCYNNTIHILTNTIKLYRGPSKYHAFAITNSSLTNINYIDYFIAIESSEVNKYPIEKYFKDNAHNMIPVRVSGNYVMWFENNDAMKDLMLKQEMK